jgi:hypothetical protein
LRRGYPAGKESRTSRNGHTGCCIPGRHRSLLFHQLRDDPEVSGVMRKKRSASAGPERSGFRGGNVSRVILRTSVSQVFHCSSVLFTITPNIRRRKARMPQNETMQSLHSRSSGSPKTSRSRSSGMFGYVEDHHGLWNREPDRNTFTAVRFREQGDNARESGA